MQLFCFTFAGGTAAFFDGFEKEFDGRIQLVKPEYPGHGTRRRERLLDTFQELTPDLYGQVREKYCGGEYALLGYSMGCIAAVEVLRYLTEKGELPPPKYIFLAAHQPRLIVDLRKCSTENIDGAVKAHTVHFGGVPEPLIDNKIFWRTYLPIFKADYLMICKYDFEKLQFTSDIPALLFYSPEDIPRGEMELWKRYFTGSCELAEYSGGHFFINEHGGEMAAIIMERLGV